ncbi:MAG: hypothetical protein DRP59_08970 [Spirochaetes bacterium]|nr:MAG: hypothetical protein DRP59_08970 [Spirochaetota bacterium]
MTENTAEIKSRIAHVDTTNDNLTGRAGLTLVSRYARTAGIPTLLSSRFSFIRKSLKGTKLVVRF